MDRKQDRELISLDEAARRLGTTQVSVLMHLRAKRFEGACEEGSWQVDALSLEAFAQHSGGVADKKLCSSGCAGKTTSCACS